jgi:RNA-binding motif X-linked protein 2
LPYFHILKISRSPDASWHADYRDTAYIYIGGLPFELSEGDVITIFSQFGEPTYINLVRDKETGKSRGFAFLKYEDQRSTDLAVDNLGGAVIMGRTLKVDHTRYKKKDDEPDEGIDLEEQSRQIEEDDGEGRRKRRRTSESESEEERPMIREERELAKLIQEHDEDDPMKAFLVQEKKEEVTLALARLKDGKRSERKHRHHHRHHKSRPKEEGDERDRDSRRSRHRKDSHRSRRSRSRD